MKRTQKTRRAIANLMRMLDNQFGLPLRRLATKVDVSAYDYEDFFICASPDTLGKLLAD